ncbi:MAG TPA: ATP-dependent DNA helicase RecG, partial [Azospira sp.]|nr:ATP-dependent DNA helicase RecG [Azospira sp.]
MAATPAKAPKSAKPAPASKAAGKAASALQQKLQRLGLHGRDDFVLHLPLRYEDETQVMSIDAAPWDEPVQVEVQVEDVSIQFRPRRQLVARVRDDSGELWLRFLNFYGSQVKQLETARDEGRKLRVFGEIRNGFFGPEMVHPRYKSVGEGAELPQSLTPVYPTTAGLAQSA